MFDTKKKRIILAIIASFLFTSCGLIIGLDKKHNSVNLDIEKPHFSIVFSHSIMGETHPCGCRHFPLGGLPQVAGLFHKLKKDKDIVYVDTGDMLFPSTVVPSHISNSLAFAALNLAKGLDKIGLNFMLIGDQDLALGWGFLNKVKKEVSFDFLISNLKDPKKVPHKKFVTIDFNEKKIFMLGIVSPESMRPEYATDFITPEKAMPELLTQLAEQGYDKNNKNHQLIVLSHAGMDADKVFAKAYPQINWIIGAHSQSFTNYPEEVGKTNIVQVLSKNHYIGEVLIASGEAKLEKPFVYHEMREQLEKELKPNPFTQYIADHKSKLEQIRDEEQKAFSTIISGNKRLSTAKSCLECHADTSAHWQNAPHSISYASLIIAKEPNNTTCIKCHSLGMGDPAGFVNINDMVSFDKEVVKKNPHHQKKYWEEVKKAFTGIESIRKLPKSKIKRLSQKWHKIDEKFKVEHNFSNVQCLNCHDQHPDHPFSVGETKTETQKFESMKKNCLSCHTPEQSPEWYGKDKRGIQSRIEDSLIKEKFKEIMAK